MALYLYQLFFLPSFFTDQFFIASFFLLAWLLNTLYCYVIDYLRGHNKHPCFINQCKSFGILQLHFFFPFLTYILFLSCILILWVLYYPEQFVIISLLVNINVFFTHKFNVSIALHSFLNLQASRQTLFQTLSTELACLSNGNKKLKRIFILLPLLLKQI